jgi:hypothetical protein
MFSIDLRPFGFDHIVHLLGEPVETIEFPDAPLLFLFDEHHSYLPGIDQAVQNACRLIDAGVVDLIGIEGKTGSLRKQVDAQLQSEGIVSSLEDFIALMKQDPAAEERVRENAPMFMYRLLLLRPKAPVWGVEDPDAYRGAAEEVAGLLADDCRALRSMINPSEVLEIALEPDPQRKARLFYALRVRDTQMLLERLSVDRPLHFLSNLRGIRKELSCSRASILNAGTLEQDRVLERIRAERDFSVVRIRPVGMPWFPRPACPPRA